MLDSDRVFAVVSVFLSCMTASYFFEAVKIVHIVQTTKDHLWRSRLSHYILLIQFGILIKYDFETAHHVFCLICCLNRWCFHSFLLLLLLLSFRFVSILARVLTTFIITLASYFILFILSFENSLKVISRSVLRNLYLRLRHL